MKDLFIATGKKGLISALVLSVFICFAGQNVMAVVDEVPPTDTEEKIDPPKKLFAGHFKFMGTAEYDGNALTCAGITASILFDADGDMPATRIIGTNRQPAEIGMIDMNLVSVKIAVTNDGEYVVLSIAQLPGLSMGGRLTAIDPDAGMLSVNGLTVYVTANTQIGGLKDGEAMTISDFEEDMPVKIQAIYEGGVYNAVAIFPKMKREKPGK